jgi:hypothetical protein
MRRRIPVAVFCGLLLAASHAPAQTPAAQSTAAAPNRTVMIGQSVIVRRTDGDATQKPRMTTVSNMVEVRDKELVLTGNVTVDLGTTRITADKAVITDGEIRFDGNVRVEDPAPEVPAK